MPDDQIIYYKRPDDFKPVPLFIGGERDGHRRCLAWSARNNRQCNAFPIAGMDVCKNHGGKALKGISAPGYKHGRYSKYLPKRMLKSYHEALSDKELLQLRDTIATLDARIVDLMQRVDIGEAGVLWAQAKSAYGELVIGLRGWDDRRTTNALAVLSDVLGRGSTDYAAWNEVLSAMEQRRRMVETERRRLVDMQQMITAEQATTLYRALTLAIQENVPDSAQLRRIQEAFIRIAEVTDSRMVEPAQRDSDD
jgi:hypothetical protein